MPADAPVNGRNGTTAPASGGASRWTPRTLGEPILEVDQLKVHFPIKGGTVYAVDGVSLTLRAGETLGIVGESGCGKTTLGRAILQLIRPTHGSVRFMGSELTSLKGKALRDMRQKMQIVFQDPRGSLDPRMNIEQIVGEPLRIHGIGSRGDRKQRVRDMLQQVGLDTAYTHRRPTELSGGQQQRVGIARALIAGPTMVVCDEPVSSLDVSIQAQVINLLTDLRDDTGVAFLFVAHNLAVVRHISDRVAVMYLGRIVESGPAHNVFARPVHPYTQGLVAAILRPDSSARQSLRDVQPLIAGDLPSPADPPPGCHFHTRCAYVQQRCKQETPALRPVTGEHAEGHDVACHFWDSIKPLTTMSATR